MSKSTAIEVAVLAVLKEFNKVAIEHSKLEYKLHYFKQDKVAFKNKEDLKLFQAGKIDIKSVATTKVGEIGILNLLQVNNEEQKVEIVRQFKVPVNSKHSDSWKQALLLLFLQDCIGMYCVVGSNNLTKPVIQPVNKS